jgi:hypothetical protein
MAKGVTSADHSRRPDEVLVRENQVRAVDPSRKLAVHIFMIQSKARDSISRAERPNRVVGCLL